MSNWRYYLKDMVEWFFIILIAHIIVFVLVTFTGASIYGWSTKATQMGLYTALISLATSIPFFVLMFTFDETMGNYSLMYLIAGFVGGAFIVGTTFVTGWFIRIMLAIIEQPQIWYPMPINWAIGFAIIAHLCAVGFSIWLINTGKYHSLATMPW